MRRADVAPAADFFRAHGAAWDALARSAGAGPGAAPFLDAWWLAITARHLAPAPAPRVVHAANVDGLAAGLAVCGGGRVPLRAIAGDHTPRFDALASPSDPAALRAVWRHLRDEEPWTVLVLPHLPEEGVAATRLAALARADGFPVRARTGARSPYVPLGGPPALSGHFRRNLDRRARRLAAEVGPARLETAGARAALDAALARGLALEAAGWKGRAGTAIADDPRVRRFYRAIARAAAARGALALHTLCAGDRPVAFHLALFSGGVYHLLKPAYDESLARLGPGHLILAAVLRELAARGARELDFLGWDTDWKREWTRRVRRHVELRVYRPTPRGRARWLAAGLRDAAAPGLRAALARVKALPRGGSDAPSRAVAPSEEPPARAVLPPPAP